MWLIGLAFVAGGSLSGVGLYQLIASNHGESVDVGETKTVQLQQGAYQLKLNNVSDIYWVNPTVYIRDPSGAETQVPIAASHNQSEAFRSTGDRDKQAQFGYYDAPETGNYTIRVERRSEDDLAKLVQAGQLDSPSDATYPSAVQVVGTNVDTFSTDGLALMLFGFAAGFTLFVVGMVLVIVRSTKSRAPR